MWRHLFELRVSFDQFLRRPDSKQSILDDFIANFNAIDEVPTILTARPCLFFHPSSL